MEKQEKQCADSAQGLEKDLLDSLVRLLARAAAAEYVQDRAAGGAAPQLHGKVDL